MRSAFILFIMYPYLSVVIFWKSCSSLIWSKSLALVRAVPLFNAFDSVIEISSSPVFSSYLFRSSSSYCFAYTDLWTRSNWSLNALSVTAVSCFSTSPVSHAGMKLFGSNKVFLYILRVCLSFFFPSGIFASFLNFLWMAAILVPPTPIGLADYGFCFIFILFELFEILLFN